MLSAIINKFNGLKFKGPAGAGEDKANDPKP
jgi:hypothetical protein